MLPPGPPVELLPPVPAVPVLPALPVAPPGDEVPPEGVAPPEAVDPPLSVVPLLPAVPVLLLIAPPVAPLLVVPPLALPALADSLELEIAPACGTLLLDRLLLDDAPPPLLPALPEADELLPLLPAWLDDAGSEPPQAPHTSANASATVRSFFSLFMSAPVWCVGDTSMDEGFIQI